MPSLYRYRIGVVCWLAATLRYRGLFANHFHADEALFAGWARQIAVWRDPLLLAQPLDKPPLLFYLQALFFPLFGPVEWAARMPNFIASLLLVPLLGLLAWRLYGDGRTAVVAALLLALSPLAIQFSATAFTDPLLTFWLVAALLPAVRPPHGHDGEKVAALSGVAFGLAAVTKYQAWLFLPLLVALALLGGWSRRDWLRWLMGAAAVGLAAVAWLIVRADAGSLVSQQLANAGGLRPVWSWELWPRLLAGAGLWQVSLGRPLIVIAMVAAGAVVIRRLRQGKRLSRISAVNVTLILFLISYGVLHWLFAVPVWDRYLLPVLPLVLLLAARAISVAVGWPSESSSTTIGLRPGGVVLAMVLVLLLLGPASAARRGRFPIGGQPTADQGAWQVAGQLRGAPYGTVLYDHWYSWQWRYHLFDTGVYVSWFPYPDALLEDLAVFGQDGSTRYLVLPISAVAEPVRRAVAAAGFRLIPEEISDESGYDGQMALYRLEKLSP